MLQSHTDIQDIMDQQFHKHLVLQKQSFLLLQLFPLYKDKNSVTQSNSDLVQAQGGSGVGDSGETQSQADELWSQRSCSGQEGWG